MSHTSSASESRRPSLLSQIRIATPCTAQWDQMVGDERMRFCNQCALHVYNLAAMTAAEAEELILRKEGNLCVRLFQRSDGTVVTQDCPRAVARVQRRRAVMAGAVASMMAVAASMGLGRDECPAAARPEGFAPPERHAVSFTVPPPAPPVTTATPPAPPKVKPLMGRMKQRTVLEELGTVSMSMGAVVMRQPVEEKPRPVTMDAQELQGRVLKE